MRTMGYYKYLTEYKVDDTRYTSSGGSELPCGRFASHLYASCDDNAKRTAQDRGIGERIISAKIKISCCNDNLRDEYLSERLIRQQKVELDDIHELTFLSYIITRGYHKHSLSVNQELLSDSGLLHTAIHYACGNPLSVDTWENFIERIEELERVVPGYLYKKPQ